MNFDLTEEQKIVKETAAKFAKEVIAPGVRERDREGIFPRDVLKKMVPLGFLGGPVPEQFGGAGLDYISHALVTEEIGKVDSSVRTTLSVQVSLVELAILRWGSEELKERYLPQLCQGKMIGCFGLTEPNAGSDPSGGETLAEDKGDYFLVNGSKAWISNGTVADLALIFAQTDKTKKGRSMVALLVETKTPGFSSRPIEGKLGLRSSDTAQLFLQDVKIPKKNILGKVGDGFKVAMTALDNGRYSVAAGCVGIAQGCLESCVQYSKERRQFGKPIGAFQLVQEMLARMAVDTEAARLLTLKAGDLKNKGISSTLETSYAKYYATEVAMRAALDAVQIFGGNGCSDEYPVERYMRDAKIAVIYEGTSQIQKLIIGRHLTGLDAFA